MGMDGSVQRVCDVHLTYRRIDVFSKRLIISFWGTDLCNIISHFNPFVPNALFLYPLKTENRKVFWCSQWVEKSCIGNEWVKQNFGVKFVETFVKSTNTNDAILVWLIGFKVTGNLQMGTSSKMTFFISYIVETTLDNSSTKFDTFFRGGIMA